MSKVMLSIEEPNSCDECPFFRIRNVWILLPIIK